MLGEENGCEDASRGCPAAGDAACVWHILDLALEDLCRIRDALEVAGLNALAEEFDGLVGRVGEAYGEAEKAVMEATEDD